MINSQTLLLSEYQLQIDNLKIKQSFNSGVRIEHLMVETIILNNSNINIQTETAKFCFDKIYQISPNMQKMKKNSRKCIYSLKNVVIKGLNWNSLFLFKQSVAYNSNLTTNKMKRGATPLAKDRLITRNSSNQNRLFKEVKNIMPTKPTLSRNASNSKIVINQATTQPPRYNPESADKNRMKSNHFTYEMRKLIVEWMLEVCHRTNIRHQQTIFMAVRLFDSGLNLMKDITASNAQLLAATCLFMSAKYEEIYPESLSKFLDYTSNSYRKGEMLIMQQKILSMMNFKLTFQTRFTFSGMMLDRETSYNTNAKKLHCLVVFLLQFSLLKTWNYNEKELGEAAVFLASKILKYPVPRTTSQKVYEIAFELMKFWQQNDESILAYLFDVEKWCCVGGLKVVY